MIVVVESNFVLELAFRQGEIAAVERIIELASKAEIELAIPACALFEPFETLVRRERKRNETLDNFRTQMRELGRSAHFPDLNQTSEGFARVLAKSVETEADALDDAILHILDCAEIIPLSEQILRDSFRARVQFSLQPQDSVVFASVDGFLNQCGKPTASSPTGTRRISPCPTSRSTALASIASCCRRSQTWWASSVIARELVSGRFDEETGAGLADGCPPQAVAGTTFAVSWEGPNKSARLRHHCRGRRAVRVPRVRPHGGLVVDAPGCAGQSVTVRAKDKPTVRF